VAPAATGVDHRCRAPIETQEDRMSTSTSTLQNAAAPLARPIATVAAAFLARLMRLARAIKHRHDAAMLGGLDDRMLADIGLTRSDLRDAFSEPLWRDPTTILVSRATERRVHRPRLPVRRRPDIADAPSLAPAQDDGCRHPAVSRF
jgi:uncharacterized protein YjiS (DUF1127 family)